MSINILSLFFRWLGWRFFVQEGGLRYAAAEATETRTSATVPVPSKEIHSCYDTVTRQPVGVEGAQRDAVQEGEFLICFRKERKVTGNYRVGILCERRRKLFSQCFPTGEAAESLVLNLRPGSVADSGMTNTELIEAAVRQLERAHQS